jgi:hypothetical protein
MIKKQITFNYELRIGGKSIINFCKEVLKKVNAELKNWLVSIWGTKGSWVFQLVNSWILSLYNVKNGEKSEDIRRHTGDNPHLTYFGGFKGLKINTN